MATFHKVNIQEIKHETANAVSVLFKIPENLKEAFNFTAGQYITLQSFNIPLRMMRGHKPTTATILEDWGWAMPTYSFTTAKTVKSVEIDKSKLMADVNLENNVYK